MARLSQVVRVASAIWLVVVFLSLLIGIPYVIGRVAGSSPSSPFEDPVVRLLFLLIASSIPAAFGLAYASHRRKIEEAERWMEGLT